MGKSGLLVAFLVGGAIGTVAALLYAPRSGEETRAIVADKVDDLLGQGTPVYSKGYTTIENSDPLANTENA